MTTPTIPFYPMTHDDALAQNVVLGQIKDAILAGPDLSMIADEFSTSTAYAVGDYVIYTGGLYRFTSAHAAGAWNSSHAQLVLVTDDLQGKQDALTFDSAPTASSGNPVTSGGVKTALDGKTNLSQVAPEFSTSTVYAIDDLVIYQGALYRFSTTHPAGAWNSSHVTACTIAEVMSHFAKFRVSGTVSSGNMTLTDARIDSEHWRVPNDGIYLGTPSNVASGINWSTNITQHTITLSATYSAATSVIVEFEWMQN